ncbi:MAG: B3/4 domain-containing protein, partial [Acidimicrobiia bacterium]
ASQIAAAADGLMQHALESARAADEVDGHVLRWQDAYGDFGVKPRVARSSVDALIRRAASDNGLARINVLVDVYNAISIIHRVPIGGEDLDHYDGPARLLLASGDEAFATTSHGEPVIEHPEPGEPVWVDDNGITCRRWNWRQTTRTAIDPDTRRVGFIIDSLDAPHHRGARAAADQLANLVGNAHVRVIDIAGAGSC